MSSQQEFLNEMSTELGLTPKALAERMGATWSTFEKWLLPSDARGAREMPSIAWQLAREILAHEKLIAQHEEFKKSVRSP